MEGRLISFELLLVWAIKILLNLLALSFFAFF
jgi:hypothetical protein